jgi:hypothetical protein
VLWIVNNALVHPGMDSGTGLWNRLNFHPHVTVRAWWDPVVAGGATFRYAYGGNWVCRFDGMTIRQRLAHRWFGTVDWSESTLSIDFTNNNMLPSLHSKEVKHLRRKGITMTNSDHGLWGAEYRYEGDGYIILAVVGSLRLWGGWFWVTYPRIWLWVQTPTGMARILIQGSVLEREWLGRPIAELRPA